MVGLTSSDRERLERARQAVRDIGAAALRSNQGRVDALTEAVDAADRGGLSADERAAAAAVAHQLVGSAGTFGYARVSRLARQLEHFLGADPSDPADPDPARPHLMDPEAARAALGDIRRDLRRDPDDED